MTNLIDRLKIAPEPTFSLVEPSALRSLVGDGHADDLGEGGTEAFGRRLNSFYDLVEEDDGLAPLFGGRVTEEHRAHVLTWWVEVTADYTASLVGYLAMLAHPRGTTAPAAPGRA